MRDCDRPGEVWASFLCALLTGRTLEVHAKLRDDEAKCYETLKEALLRRYDHTAEENWKRFRTSRPEWHTVAFC